MTCGNPAAQYLPSSFGGEKEINIRERVDLHGFDAHRREEAAPFEAVDLLVIPMYRRCTYFIVTVTYLVQYFFLWRTCRRASRTFYGVA